ncbi:MAG: hypothetical protein A2Y81_01135 [Nitrospirae bacterium RBG_13_43_8]|nr:MAG: hypothetical protein A2Y81_01135 [Nitrospirae bacterium RBG_13_43_8]
MGENVGFYTDTGRSAGTAYAYRVRSYNAGGNSDYSNCSASKTGAAGSPKAPSYLKAISASASKINLRWQDNSTDEARFKIYRKVGTGTWALLFKTAADAISYSDTTATGNNSTTAYAYYIQACNKFGCSPTTSWAVVPFAPIDLQTNAVSADQVDLTWTDMSKNESGFEVYRKAGDCKSTSSWVLRGTVTGAASYSDTHVTSGSTYAYRVRAYKRSAARPYANGYSRYTTCSSVTP